MSNIQTSLKALSLTVLIYHLYQLSSRWQQLPKEIPQGSKYLLFIIPILAAVLWLLIGYLSKHPSKLKDHNLTAAKKDQQSKRTDIVTRIVQNASFCALLFSNQAMLESASGLSDQLPQTLAIILAALSISAPLYLLIRRATSKDSRHNSNDSLTVLTKDEPHIHLAGLTPG